MDRTECRRAEEALDRKAWLKAYRAARRGKRGEGMAARACACLDARARASARELEHIDFRPRPAGFRAPVRVNWFGETVPA